MNSQILDLRVRISDVFFLAASLHLSVLGTDAPVKAAKGTAIPLVSVNATEARSLGLALPAIFAKTETANPFLTKAVTETGHLSLSSLATAIVSLSRPALGKISSSEFLEKNSTVRKVINTFLTTPAAISPPAKLDMKFASLLAAERPTPSPASNAMHLNLSTSEGTTAQLTSQMEVEDLGENVKADVVSVMRASKSAKEKMVFQETTGSRNIRSSTEIPSAPGISKVFLAPTIRTKRTTKPPYAPAVKSPAVTMAVLRTKIRTFTSVDMDNPNDIEKFLKKVCQMLKSILPVGDCEPTWRPTEVVQILVNPENADAD
ncbi:uncharacterized protein LOC115464950 isoform X2 [Microcaecilia unicolor]|uniref:Uncharacterized protein LOC115464950 isoform X2 n=1 Tax=Microcaecilia unicolor TaxID=1415580 RepID=A0A6P7X6H5_9AMPH|nr:uncharacterized protein LOC115464950 isoform X2 [Microcaecilia unicolor]